MSRLPLHILRHEDPLAIVRLDPGTEPDWDWRVGPLATLTRTAVETSIICPEAAVPSGLRAVRGFTAFEVGGPLDYAAVGIISSLVVPLAAKEVPIMSMSTYETDWVLVPSDRADEAERAWRDSGFFVTPTSLDKLPSRHATSPAQGAKEDQQ